MIGFLQQNGKVYVGGKDAPKRARVATTPPSGPSTPRLQRHLHWCKRCWPAATQRLTEPSRSCLTNAMRCLEIDGMARVSARGANVVGNKSAFSRSLKKTSPRSCPRSRPTSTATEPALQQRDRRCESLPLGVQHLRRIDQSANSYWQATVIARRVLSASPSLIPPDNPRTVGKNTVAGRYGVFARHQPVSTSTSRSENLITYHPGDNAGTGRPVATSPDGYIQPPVYVLPGAHHQCGS